jgi:hypothetical protein
MTATLKYQEALAPNNASFLVDHITLEPDFKTWHVTRSTRKKRHMPGLCTVPLGEDRLLWFGMSIKDFSVLRIAKKTTIAAHPSAESDSSRRLNLAMEADKNGACGAVSFHPEVKLSGEDRFPHFAFIIGPKGFPDYTGEMLGLPVGSIGLTTPFRGTIQFMTHHHRVHIANELDLQITTVWLPGAITVPILFTGR